MAFSLASAQTAKPTATASTPASGATSKAAEVYSEWPFDAKEAVKRQDDTAKALGIPKEVTLDLGNKVTMKFILIPAGKFMMGKSGSGHETTIKKPYYMAVYKVTQAQYEQIMDVNPSAVKGDKNWPVSKVTVSDAEDFCQKLAKKTGKAIGIATDQQWENACRAGMDTKFFWGDDETKIGDYVWYRENMDSKMHAVGQKKPNNFGLYDICGLMWEYTRKDTYDPAKKDDTGKDHATRGATWGSRPPMFEISTSGAAPTDPAAQGMDRYGMRVMMELP